MPSQVQGPDRQRLRSEEIEKFRASLVVDTRRRRPLYFDGRFLTASDLVRDQDYFLTRQADLGRATGFGVAEGLFVAPGATPTSLVIGAGHGVTPGGELVVLPRDFTVELTEIPDIQRLNAAFGLLEVPNDPPRSRTGLFVVALRPVEYSANPVASYPTSLTGPRSVEDGEIVEGAAVTLIPYVDEGPNLTADLRRARVAHEIFVGGTRKGMPTGALPLALVSLNSGTVEWLDVFAVRREVGSGRGDVLGMGFAPRGLREAHLLQYESHLREVLALRKGYRFPASEYFMALPPAGRLPAATVDPTDFTQIFFPPTVDVDLSLVPEDEIPALVEESLTLQPIDLTRSADELDSTAVLVLVPVSREDLRTLSSTVSRLERTLKPAAPGMLARRNPLEHLRGLRLPANFLPHPEPEDAEDEAWAHLLRRSGMLWYVRRRNLHDRADLAGEEQLLEATRPPARSDAELRKLEEELKERASALTDRENAVQKRETDADKRLKELEKRENAQSSDLDTRARELDRRETELTRREAEVRKLEADVTRRDAEVRQRETAVAQREADLRRRESGVADSSAEIKRLQEQLAGRTITLDARQKELDNRASQLAAQERTLASQTSAIKLREDRVVAIERDLKTMEPTLAKLPLNTTLNRTLTDIRRL